MAEMAEWLGQFVKQITTFVCYTCIPFWNTWTHSKLFCKLSEFINIVHLYVHGKRIEPNEKSWVQCFCIHENKYKETPIHLVGRDSLFTWDNMNASNKIWYYGKNCDGSILCIPATKSYCSCDVNTNFSPMLLFFSVEYINKYGHSTYLDVPRELYQADNCLFSKEWVARYFEYHVVSLEYTPQYTLVLVDHALNTIQLSPANYIICTSKKGEYKIHTSK
jgi:hypothetical protein